VWQLRRRWRVGETERLVCTRSSNARPVEAAGYGRRKQVQAVLARPPICPSTIAGCTLESVRPLGRPQHMWPNGAAEQVRGIAADQLVVIRGRRRRDSNRTVPVIDLIEVRLRNLTKRFDECAVSPRER
jgi:hypothetical protein